MNAFRSLLARGQDISTAATPPVKRKTLCSVAALLAFCVSATSLPGAHAAVSTRFSYGPVVGHAQSAQDMPLPGAQPVTRFDAIWPSLHDVDGVFAQPLAQNGDSEPFGMRMPPEDQTRGTVCSRLASMCLPLADAYGAQATDDSSQHQWFGHVIELPALDPSGTAVQAASGPIDTTLRESLDQAGLPASVAAQIATLFAGHVDPDARAQPGDTFRLLLDGSDAQASPRIASIELRLQGETYDALWFTAPGAAHGAYYTLEGVLLADMPFAMPLDYRRVSSPFGMRTHPVFGEPRFHEGVDLTAPVGTPIYAAAAGTLELAAREHGYGKLVVLRHDNGYSTRYAHMASWASGLKIGQRIEQGQMIGLVGRTGVTTGAHLHFEVRRYDEPLDPLTLTSREFVAPLDGTARMAFEADAEAARTNLAALSQPASRMASIMKPGRFIG